MNPSATATHIQAVDGKLPENILYFARALRDAGLRLGPSRVVEAVARLKAAFSDLQ